MTDIAHAPGDAHPWQLPSPPSVREVVSARIRRAIVEQEIRPGTRVRQTQLAEALGVSRMPVRDAIQELVAEGLLRALPGGGVQVPPFEVREVLDALGLQAPLETEAVRAVSLAVHPASVLTRLDAGPTGPDFHRALCRLAGNRFLLTALTPVWAQADRAAFVLTATTGCRPGCPDHTAITGALVDGDTTAAVTALHGHLAARRDEVAEWARRERLAS